MNKKTVGILITALIIGAMVVLTVKSNLEKAEPIPQSTGTGDSLAETTGFKPGNIPPDFELTTLSGDVVKLSDYKGKKVILNFWASWCGPCKAEMPHMENYYKKNKESDNVEIVAVNLTKQERKGMDGIEKFVDAFGLNFPIPLDEDGRVMDAYAVIGIPTSYFINTDGTIGQKVVAAMDEKTLKEYVDKLN
ncbi:redoxin domain-containing protein [Sporosarcina sp. FA9]|uniref:redoxin domain-containing protein n=1 Tax=Sporosarcina sp. FA9 TaxID=3413030 RepID=UPI003F65664F